MTRLRSDNLLGELNAPTGKTPGAGARTVAQTAPAPKLDLPGVPLPTSAVVRMGTVQHRQEVPIYHLAYSPDGKYVVTDEDDQKVRIWDAAGIPRAKYEIAVFDLGVNQPVRSIRAGGYVGSDLGFIEACDGMIRITWVACSLCTTSRSGIKFASGQHAGETTPRPWNIDDDDVPRTERNLAGSS